MDGQPQPEGVVAQPDKAMAALQLVEYKADPGDDVASAVCADVPPVHEGCAQLKPERFGAPELLSFDQLPDEIVRHVLAFLYITDLVNLRIAFPLSGRIEEAVRYIAAHTSLPVRFAYQAARSVGKQFEGLEDCWLRSRHEYCQLILGKPDLRHLNIRNKYETGDVFLLLPSSLEVLRMARCQRLNSRNLRGLTSCSQLRRLELWGFVHLDETDLAEVIAHCTQLEELVLDRSPGVESKHMSVLTKCGSLRDLDVSRCWEIEEEDIAAVVAACPRFERLTMEENCSKRPEFCLPPAGSTQLRYLNITRTRTSDNTLVSLPALAPSLETLVMRGCLNISGKTFGSLRQLCHLKTLDVRLTTGVTDASLKKLIGCQLEELWIKPRKKQCSAQGITRFVLSCPSLTTLYFENSFGCPITSADLRRLWDKVPANRNFTLVVPECILNDLKSPPWHRSTGESIGHGTGHCLTLLTEGRCWSPPTSDDEWSDYTYSSSTYFSSD